MSFGEFATNWRDTVMPSHKLSTQSMEKNHINRYLIPYFGEMDMGDIAPVHLQRFIAGLTLNPKTVRNIIGTFRLIWKTAKSWGTVTHNACDGIVLPRKKPPKRRCFSLEEIQRIIAAAEEPYRTIYWLAAETGLRAGEITGLRVCDVDTRHHTVQVRQSVWKGRVQTPKSTSALRTLAVSKALADALERHCAGGGDPLRFVFSTRNGTPLDGHDIVFQKLQPLLERLGIEPGGLHAFRHANATLLVSRGVDIRTAATRLGHADPSLTLRVYAHAIREKDREVADQMGTILCPLVPTVEAEVVAGV